MEFGDIVIQGGRFRALTSIFRDIWKRRKRLRKKPKSLRRKMRNRLLRDVSRIPSRKRFINYPTRIAFISLFHYWKSKLKSTSETEINVGNKSFHISTNYTYSTYYQCSKKLAATPVMARRGSRLGSQVTLCHGVNARFLKRDICFSLSF